MPLTRGSFVKDDEILFHAKRTTVSLHSLHHSVLTYNQYITGSSLRTLGHVLLGSLQNRRTKKPTSEPGKLIDLSRDIVSSSSCSRASRRIRDGTEHRRTRPKLGPILRQQSHRPTTLVAGGHVMSGAGEVRPGGFRFITAHY